MELFQNSEIVDIRIYQRKNKYITTVSGINRKFNLEKICREYKKKYGCGSDYKEVYRAEGTLVDYKNNSVERNRLLLHAKTFTE